VVKNKVNTGTSSKYATLDYLQQQCDETIFRHGFSYSWNEEPGEGGRKRTLMYIYGYGHMHTVVWEAPTIEGNRATNALQCAGIQSTYGQRYTYKAGFGIVVKGEDADGQIVEIDGDMQAALDKIKSAETVEALMAVYQTAYERYRDNQSKLRVVVGEYTLAKQAIIKGGGK
jgi:hypothetical protein